ncbi:cell division protein PerM [Glutamicibacter sp. TV12E]|uniref:cell division protein PerM n=1 Tax=Glutamicibacter sp. TV12E TaxID=3446362 RepID=UPI00403446EB
MSREKKPMKAVMLRLRNGWPMPLALQGVFEILQSVVFCLALIMLPLVAVYFSGGFLEDSFNIILQFAGFAWLLIHGVPVELLNLGPEADPASVSGWITLIPLGLSLLPFLFCLRAGRRIARASYTDQLWQGLLGAFIAYGGIGAAVGSLSNNSYGRVNVLAATFIPLVIAALGLIIGARREAGSWARLFGVDMAAYIQRISPHRRWAGSYVWHVIVAGFLGYVAAVGISGLLLTINLGLHWTEVANVYQELRPGPIGSAALTLVQLSLIPNAVFWVLSWISGGGFTLGTGSTLSTLETTVGPLPSIPMLASLPTGEMSHQWLFLLLPVAAGIMAGWYFLRGGENHLEDWFARRIPFNMVSLGLSTACLSLFTGIVAAALSLIGSWLASGSLAIGRLVDLGPNLWLTAGALVLQVGVGTAIGYLIAPLFETDPVLEG